MHREFSTVAVVARHHTSTVLETVQAVERVLARLGAAVIVDQSTAKRIDKPTARRIEPRDRLAGMCDLVVVVGGDGSLLGVAREFAPHGVPVVGVNRGGLGFLAAVSPDQLFEQLGSILAGDYDAEEHFLLQGRIRRSGREIGGSTALNDVVIHAGNMARMMEFELWVNGEYVYDQRSDGVIVASPTGSTAYALSAGGPIMHPALDALVIVPMFPHTLTSRPLVLPGDARICIKVGWVGESVPQVSFDSQVNIDLRVDDEVCIQKYACSLQLLYPRGHSFYESCRSKLDWATRLGGRIE